MNDTFQGCTRECPGGQQPVGNICPCLDGTMPQRGWCGGWGRRGGWGRIHVWGRQIPTYSYVYTYTNKTTGNITYPEYNVTTTRWEGENYKEPEGWQCPCDLEEFTTGTKDINKIVEQVAKSVAEQQKAADAEFYAPLLADPEDAPAVPEPHTSFFEEQDLDGLDFFDKDANKIA